MVSIRCTITYVAHPSILGGCAHAAGSFRLTYEWAWYERSVGRRDVAAPGGFVRDPSDSGPAPLVAWSLVPWGFVGANKWGPKVQVARRDCYLRMIWPRAAEMRRAWPPEVAPSSAEVWPPWLLQVGR